jgi:hypothetical protein
MHPTLSHISFRNILLLTLWVSLGIGGTLLTYSATDSTVSNITTMVNTQCNKDKACIREVANGLERAVGTLMQVVRELNAQLANMPDTQTATPTDSSPISTNPNTSTQIATPDGVTPTPGTTPVMTSEDLWCYYRMTDVMTKNDSFKDNIETFRIDHQSKVTDIVSSRYNCNRITLTCADTKIQVIGPDGWAGQISFVRSYVMKNNWSDRPYLIYSSLSGAYLGENTNNCVNSEEYRQLKAGSTVGSAPTPVTITDWPTIPRLSPDDVVAWPGDAVQISTDTTLSPNNPAVAGLPAWPTTSNPIVCPIANKDGYYSSYYQCRGVVISCDLSTGVTSNLWPLKDVRIDNAITNNYSRVTYPQYLGKNYDDCKIALQHASALERAGVYR